MNKSLRASWSGGRIERRRREALRLRVTGRAGEVLRVEARGRGVAVESDCVLEVARKRPLDESILCRQLGRLGETPYALESVENGLEGEVMIPPSALNRVRRALVAKLEQAAPERQRAEPTGGLAELRGAMRWGVADRQQDGEAGAAVCALSVLCRTPAQIGAALEAGVPYVLVDFEDLRRGKDAVAQVRGRGGDSKVILAMPRIQKPGEAGFFKLVERAEPDGVLLRNLGGVAYFREHDALLRLGDFSLNVANSLSADYFLGLGLDRVTISYDLAVGQVLDLLRAAPDAGRFELTLHQHMPMFHMEHCVFCAFISEGTDVTNCGRPCDRHAVQLRDRVGMLHPLKADVGCRNTLFNGRAQTGARFFPALRNAGLRHFRVELLDEDRAEAAATIAAYRALLEGDAGGEALWQGLKASSKLGVTVGTLEG